MPNDVPPLHLHIAFVDTCAQGVAWFKRLSRWFMGDRNHYAAPEANIPVFVWSGDAAKPPSDIPWTDAGHTALVLFIDNPCQWPGQMASMSSCFTPIRPFPALSSR